RDAELTQPKNEFSLMRPRIIRSTDSTPRLVAPGVSPAPKTKRPRPMLAKYSIRAKIIAVLAFLLVAMTGMGLLAVRNMRAINANTVDIATNWMPSVRVLGELRAGVITYRNVIREHMLVETLEEKQASEKILAGGVEANTKIRAAYEPMITSAEERAL